MEDLGDAVNDLGLSLIAANDERIAARKPDRVTLAHYDAQTYKAEQFVDLHDFCIQIYQRFEGDDDVQEACRKVVRILNGNATVFETIGQDCPRHR